MGGSGWWGVGVGVGVGVRVRLCVCVCVRSVEDYGIYPDRVKSSSIKLVFAVIAQTLVYGYGGGVRWCYRK